MDDVKPTFERGQINTYSSQLDTLHQVQSVIDPLDGRKFDGLNHKVNQVKFKAVEDLLYSRPEKRNFAEVKAKFQKTVMELKGTYVEHFKQLLEDPKATIPAATSKAALQQQFEQHLTQRLEAYCKSFVLEESMDLQRAYQQLYDLVLGRNVESEALNPDEFVAVPNDDLNSLTPVLAPIVQSIKDEIVALRHKEPKNIFEACFLGDLDAVREYVESFQVDGENTMAKFINARDETSAWKFTALHYAAYQGNPAVVAYLLSQGADPNLYSRMEAPKPPEKGFFAKLFSKKEELPPPLPEPSERGYTALHYAAEKPNDVQEYDEQERADTVRRLIHGGADVNIKGRFLRTPLHTATFYKQLLVAQQLMTQAGTECNALTTPDGWAVTPLDNAVHLRDRKMVMMLLKDNRINPHVTGDANRASAFEQAVTMNFKEDNEVVDAFLENANFRKDPEQPFIQELNALLDKIENKQGLVHFRIKAYVSNLLMK